MYNYTANCGKDKYMAILKGKNKIANSLMEEFLWLEREIWKMRLSWMDSIIQMGARSVYLLKKFKIQKTLNNY